MNCDNCGKPQCKCNSKGGEQMEEDWKGTDIHDISEISQKSTKRKDEREKKDDNQTDAQEMDVVEEKVIKWNRNEETKKVTFSFNKMKHILRFELPLSEALPTGVAILDPETNEPFGATTRVEDAFEKPNRLVIVFEEKVENMEVERLRNELELYKKRLADSVLENPVMKKHSLDDTLTAIRKGNYSPPEFPKSKTEYYGRDDSLAIARNYIRGVVSLDSLYYNIDDKKFTLLGTSGMKGIGKTQLLYQIGSKIDKANDKNVKSFYLSFNGGATNKTTYTQYLKASQPNTAFGQLLLNLCKVPEEFHTLLNFSQCLIEFRSILQLAEDDILLILIDEIGFLEAPDTLLHTLMSEMDAQKGKLIFIFAHISTQFLTSASTGSGRKVIPLPLPPLDIDIWKQTNPALVGASAKFPSLHQLFLSLSGHPRAIFDGIKAAISIYPTLLDNPDDQIAVARQAIIWECKFYEFTDDKLEDVIMKWFSQARPTEKERIDWKTSGLLHTMKSGTQENEVEFLFPLLVQDWSRRQSGSIPLAFHLNQLYLSDTKLDQDNEKAMEAVMYHYEAVLRIAQGGVEFIFDSFYCSQQRDETKFKYKVKSDVPQNMIFPYLVVPVEQFVNDKLRTLVVDDPQSLFDTLRSGTLVFSQHHSEVGIEYLSPFINVSTQSLEIAFVQCKFVNSSTAWTEIEQKMNISMEAFKKNPLFSDIKMIPVVYTTVNQKSLHKSTFKDGIYFTATDIFNFTKKLGILRMHTQKLGSVLSGQYPVLQRASSDVNDLIS